jgi:C4-dicarboxylate transporter DctQ subunit
MARRSALGGLQAGLEAAVCGVMITAVLLNFANVVGRYVFFQPIVVAEEVLQFMNVWVVMLGAATITRENRHLHVDVLYRGLSPALRRTIDLLTTLLALALTVYVIAQAFRVMAILHASGQRSVAAGIPMALMYAAMPLGFGCGVLFLLHRLRTLAAERRAVMPAAGPELL